MKSVLFVFTCFALVGCSAYQRGDVQPSASGGDLCLSPGSQVDVLFLTFATNDSDLRWEAGLLVEADRDSVGDLCSISTMPAVIITKSEADRFVVSDGDATWECADTNASNHDPQWRFVFHSALATRARAGIVTRLAEAKRSAFAPTWKQVASFSIGRLGADNRCEPVAVWLSAELGPHNTGRSLSNSLFFPNAREAEEYLHAKFPNGWVRKEDDRPRPFGKFR